MITKYVIKSVLLGNLGDKTTERMTILEAVYRKERSAAFGT
jgi:hypothetical protein